MIARTLLVAISFSLTLSFNVSAEDVDEQLEAARNQVTMEWPTYQNNYFVALYSNELALAEGVTDVLPKRLAHYSETYLNLLKKVATDLIQTRASAFCHHMGYGGLINVETAESIETEKLWDAGSDGNLFAHTDSTTRESWTEDDGWGNARHGTRLVPHLIFKSVSCQLK